MHKKALQFLLKEEKMADHCVDVVDENDKIIGKALKSEKFSRDFISRTVAVFLRDSSRKYLICKRSPCKKDSANLWDLAACGSVEAGETYEDAAERELKEETGISCDLMLLDKFYQEVVDKKKNLRLKYFCGVFLGTSDEEPELNDELVGVRKMGFNELDADLIANPGKYCSGLQNDFKQVKGKLKNQ